MRYVYRNGQTVRGQLCSLKYIVNDRRDTYRLAVVVSKKVNKSAVARNRIRRRVYETFRQYEPKITRPYDIVFTVFNEQLADLPPNELNELVRGQLKQAGVL